MDMHLNGVDIGKSLGLCTGISSPAKLIVRNGLQAVGIGGFSA